MRLVSLTRLQCCGGKNSLGIRIPFRAGAGLIVRALVPAELASEGRVCKFAAAEFSPTLAPPPETAVDRRAFGGRYVRRHCGFAPTLYCACRFLWRAIKPLHVAIPAAHGIPRKYFRGSDATGSRARRCMLACNHINKGGCRGPFVETRSSSGVRRVCVRWRDLAGGILSSSGQRQPSKAGNGERIQTPESKASPVFCFSQAVMTRVTPPRCWARRGRRN